MVELSVRQQTTADLRQEQTLTHQQIQAVEMLAAPIAELQTYVNSELQENPLLEADQPSATAEELPVPDSADSEDKPNDDEWIQQLVELSESGRRPFSEVNSMSGEEQERHEYFMNSLPVRTTREESLLEQIRFMNPPDEVSECCSMIIASLDEDAYLQSHPADLAMVQNVSMEIIQEAIRLVQQCDPAGVGVRDLRERLQIQLRRRGQEETLAFQLVNDHLDDLAANRIPTLARRLSVPVDDIRAAVAVIQELEPRLSEGDDFYVNMNVREEVEILERGGELIVRMLNEDIPTLRISEQYKHLLNDESAPAETKEYVKEKIRSAAFLINCISQRQSTLERIVQAIVEAQENFFREGMHRMQPLTMAEVAEKIGVHETTISRGVSGKFLRCRYGLLPLRQFFSNGYLNENGATVSSLAVKTAIRQVIDNENKEKPLSDSRISTVLGDQGLQVARRTVAKYREALGVLPAKLRREYW